MTLLLTGLSVRLLAAPLPPPRDELGQINFWQALLKQKPDNYRLYLVDAFEGDQLWQSRVPSTPLNVVNYVYKSPSSKAFTTEKELISRYHKSSHRQALYLHTAFEHPGQLNYQLDLKNGPVLKGRLLRASLWVHSQNYPHRLELVFSNYRGRQVKVSGGYLDFHGWRRIDIRLPPQHFNPPRQILPGSGHRLLSIRIISHPRAESGAVALLLDNLVVYADLRHNHYPGAEFGDTW